MGNTEVLRKVFVPRLPLARQHAGLSHAQAAKLLDFSCQTITEMEAGRRKVTMDELVSISDIYDVSVEWLTCSDIGYTDEIRDRLQIAARDVAEMKQEDFDRVMTLLTSLKTKDNEQ